VRNVGIVTEKYSDGFVAYPHRVKGGMVGERAPYEDALAEVRFVLKFHVETFGSQVSPGC
jgi:hypothetical protein